MSDVYEWDPSTARFRDPASGRYVARSEVTNIVDQIILKSQARITADSDRFRSGLITLEEWQADMRQEIKRVHLATEAMVRGGWNQLGPSDFGRVGARVKEQYAYLSDFTQQLLNGEIRTDGAFMSRARLYAASVRASLHESMTEVVMAAGYTEERNVLHPAEHCTECLDQSAAGYVPLGTLVPIGARQCLGNDKCTMRYR